MPRGPKGGKRRAEVIGNTVHVMRIATGEIDDSPSKAPKRAKGGKARAKALTPNQRTKNCKNGGFGTMEKAAELGGFAKCQADISTNSISGQYRGHR